MQFEVTYLDGRKETVGFDHFSGESAFWAITRLQVGQGVHHHYYRRCGYKQIVRIA